MFCLSGYNFAAVYKQESGRKQLQVALDMARKRGDMRPVLETEAENIGSVEERKEEKTAMQIDA